MRVRERESERDLNPFPPDNLGREFQEPLPSALHNYPSETLGEPWPAMPDILLNDMAAPVMSLGHI